MGQSCLPSVTKTIQEGTLTRIRIALKHIATCLFPLIVKGTSHTHTHCSQICPITYNHVCLVGTSIVPTTESLSYRFITPTIQLHYHLGATNLLDKLNRTKPVATAASLSFYIILHSVDSGYTPTYHEPTRSLQIQGQHLINPTKHQSSPRSHVAKSHGNRILASK